MLLPAPTGTRVSRLVVATAAVVLLAGLALTFLGAWRTGVSWDESYHVMRLRNALDHGWYLLDQDLDGGRPGAWTDLAGGGPTYVYGPVAALLLHAWTVLWGGEGWGTVSSSAHAYALRHLGVALIATLGVAATAGLGGLVTRRREGALLAAAVLVAVPTWTGHAMFNLKDVPVATGYTFVTLGCALLLTRRAAPGWGAALVAAGLVLAVGTRPGIWPGLGLACAITVLVSHRRWRDLAWLAGAAGVAYGVLLAAYPVLFAHPVPTLIHSVSGSADFGGKAGQWWYLPVFLVVELPTLWLIAGAIGAVIAVRHRRSPVLLLVLAQTFALPALAIVHRSNIYTGIRQFLFAAPGLAVLVTVALFALIGARPVWGPRLVAVALVVPMIGATMLFPYVYAFESAPANALVPVLAEHDKALEVQTDYWRTSVRELAPQIPAGAFVTCSPELRDGLFWRHSNETSDDCASSLISPLTAYDDRRTLPWTGSATEFLAVRQGNDTIASNCTKLGAVTRRLWWRQLTMSTVSRCELPVADHPGGTVGFTGAGEGASLLLGGWLLHPANDADLLAPGTSGSLGFRAPHPGALHLTGSLAGLSDGGTLTVNGVGVPLRTDGDRVSADIPASVAEAWNGRLVLTVTAGGAEVALRELTIT